MLKGKHIVLTAVEKEDLVQLKNWRNIPDFRKKFREYREINDEMQESWYNKIVLNDKNTIMFSIRDVSSNELLGCCGLCYINWVNRYADLSFYIGKDELYADNIYALDAIDILIKYGFNELCLNKIWTEIYEFDSMKIDLLEGYGFKRDGLLRQNYFYDGKYWDSIIFSLLQSDIKKGE